MRHDLLKLFRERQDFTHAIVLTHNIDFIFLQSVVLPELKRCGHPTLTVFADANCAAASYAYQAPLLGGLGLRYRVVPVALKPGFCFHPKAVLLSGTQKGLLFVGSGNLTFGGWRENAEVWVQFDSEIDGTGVFAAFQAYLQDVLDLVHLSDPVRGEVDEAFDGSTREWAKNLDAPTGLLGKAGKGEPLRGQILSSVGDRAIQRLTVCSPYFDPKAEALGELVDNFKPLHAELLVQNKRTGLTRANARSLPAQISVKPVRLRARDEEEGERERFLHAKFYAVEHDDRVTVFVGSANCSHAALTIPGSSGNAELLAVQNLTINEYQENYLGELEFQEGEAEFPEEVTPPDEPDQDHKSIRLLAARYEAGLLRLGIDCPAAVSLTGCVVDNVRYEPEMQGDGLARVRVDAPPRQAAVVGLDDGKEVFSNLCWVDHELELRATARSRSLAGTIRTRVVSGQWNLGAWTEIMEMLLKHLQYMPISSIRKTPKVPGGSGRPRLYSESDVFASGYGLHFPASPMTPIGYGSWPKSFQQLLLRWLGVGLHEDSGEGNSQPGGLPPKRPPEQEGNLPPESEDHPPDLPSIPKPLTPVEVSERDRQRAIKLLGQVTQWMGGEAYLKDRQPEHLAVDLQITSGLLRAALHGGWVSPEEFFNYTHQLWLSLFFTSKVDPTMGWVDYRYQSAESPEDFAARMESPILSAAMAAWALGVPTNIHTPEYARFRLACVLAVARLPWLWRAGPEDAIAVELQKVLALTGVGERDKRWKAVNDQWVKLIRQGEALRRLEIALAGRQPKDLRHEIKQDAIAGGELLWQGKVGFLVAKSPTRRSSDEGVRLLYLQTNPASPAEDKPDEAEWRGEGKRFLIPLKALLDERVIPFSEKFGDQERHELLYFIKELAECFAANDIH
ncbi:MAG: hypothetical protein ACOZFS_09900 [Thermodesulfobacteriota bacterium]